MMMQIADRILLALFSLSRDTRPIDATRLGRATGHSATLAARALLFLEKHGWVDATRARLTLLGLARAVQIGASHGGGGGTRRGPVALRSVEAGGSNRIAPKARRKPPLAAGPALPVAPAAVASLSVDPRDLDCRAAEDASVAIRVLRAARSARRPCARANAQARRSVAALA